MRFWFPLGLSLAVLSAASTVQAVSDKALRALDDVRSISLEYEKGPHEQIATVVAVFECEGKVLDHMEPDDVALDERPGLFEIAWAEDGATYKAGFVAPSFGARFKSPYFRFLTNFMTLHCRAFPDDLQPTMEKFLGYPVAVSAGGAAEVRSDDGTTRRVSVKLHILYIPRENADPFEQRERISKHLKAETSEYKAAIDRQLAAAPAN